MMSQWLRQSDADRGATTDRARRIAERRREEQVREMKACGRIGTAPAALAAGSALLGLFSASAASASGYGRPEPGQIGFQAARHRSRPLPSMVSQFDPVAVDRPDLPLRSGAARLCRLAIQRKGQSDALEDHPSHRSRSGLDHRAGDDSRGHRDAVVPIADDATDDSAGRRDDQGDGVAMALDLRLSARTKAASPSIPTSRPTPT